MMISTAMMGGCAGVRFPHILTPEMLINELSVSLLLLDEIKYEQMNNRRGQ